MAVVVGPSVVFLCAVIGVGWHLAGGAVQERSTAALVGNGIEALAASDTAVVRERGVSVRGGNDRAAARAATDSAGDAVRDVTARVAAGAPAGVRDSFATLGDAVAAVDRARRGVKAVVMLPHSVLVAPPAAATEPVRGRPGSEASVPPSRNGSG